MGLRLTLHLVPETSYGKNLREKIGRDWQELRRIRSAHGRKCVYCGWVESGGKYTHLHELWDYDDERHIQKLIGFECVCPDCHSIHHWGFSKFKGLDMDYLLEHACEINGCSESEFRKHIEDSFETWRERSRHTWTTDTSFYTDLKY